MMKITHVGNDTAFKNKQKPRLVLGFLMSEI